MTTPRKVLFVDDNENLLNAVRRNLRGKFELVVAGSAKQAMQILESDKSITIVISDQKMPEVRGSDFLAAVARRWPAITRIMQTGNNDPDTMEAAINTGHVFRFIHKPYEPQDLIDAIEDAQAAYDVRVAEREMLETTLAGSVRLMTELLGLSHPELFRQASRVQALAKAVSAHIYIPRFWELELGCMLYPLGMVTLGKDVSVSASADPAKAMQARAYLAKSGIISALLVGRIPKLEQVAEDVRLSRKGFDGSGLPEDGLTGIDIPLNARLLHIMIDLVEAAAEHNVPLATAMRALHQNRNSYDPALLTLVERAAHELAAEGADLSPPAGAAA